MSDLRQDNKTPKRVGRYAGAGVELAAAVGALCLAGYWVDRKFGTDPWGMLVGAVTGIVGGLYNLIRPALRTALRPPDEESRSDRKQPNQRADDDQP